MRRLENAPLMVMKSRETSPRLRDDTDCLGRAPAKKIPDYRRRK